MKNIWVIFTKELRSYFASPIAYVIMALYAALFGFFFYSYVSVFQQMTFRSQMMGQSYPMNVNEMIIRPVLMNVSVIGLFLIPMISMRLFAEEKRTGTIELLMTSPIRDAELIIGKWAAALGLYVSILAFASFNLIFLFAYAKPDWKPVLIGYLGLILQAGFLLAIGAFISSTTKNQIIAGVGSFCVSLLFWVLEWTASFDPTPVSKVLAYMSVVTHFEPFSKGVLDSKDVIYFLTAIFFGLFLTARSTESLRWRA